MDPEGHDTSRQLNKDDVPTLQQDLQSIERQIKEITIEIEHAKRQEAYLNQANGKSIFWDSLDTLVADDFSFRIDSKSLRVVQLSFNGSIIGDSYLANLVFKIILFCKEINLEHCVHSVRHK